ncbi:MAG: sigma-70 family RNA polymerase sigma factor [Nitrospirales bacterium]|nr:sigma-70 family RNA polymerase sigma factor [Nitrospirales bacterium]
MSNVVSAIRCPSQPFQPTRTPQTRSAYGVPQCDEYNLLGQEYREDVLPLEEASPLAHVTFSANSPVLNHLRDSELIERVKVREEQAFEVLYWRYAHRVYRYILTIIRDHSMAEEVLEEVMVVVWKGANQFKGLAKVSSWIFAIARHKAFDDMRRRYGAHSQTVEIESVENLLIDQHAGPEELAEQKTLAALVNRAMTNLAWKHREIIHLTYFEKLSCKEISELLDIPVGTVKSRLYHARKELKEQLKALGIDEDPC